jgi:uncharacterized repeat protein (TIGR03803 family)
VLHSFSGSDGAFPGGDYRPGQAIFPGGDLYRDSNGNLYGTTSLGGSGCGGSGCGVVFKLAPDGTNFTVLHSFAGGTSDGANPIAGLIADSSGNLYGMTNAGGASGSGCFGFVASGCGVVFKVSPDGTNYTVLYSFCSKPSCSDGANPDAGLIADSSGNLYGTTSLGGVGKRHGVQAHARRDRDGALLLHRRQRRGFSASRPDRR